MLTVVETRQFIREAENLFSEEERRKLVDYLAWNPLAGDQIVGSGGIRKVRFRTGNRGKSGSARVIYFFYTEEIPLYLLTCYGKGAKGDLTQAEIAGFAKLSALIKSQARKRRQ